MTQHFSVDHSVTVPLHFLTPDMKIPVIPFFISGHVPPLPPAQRCYALGQAVARAIESWPAPLRVVVMGSGSFSLEVGGPRMAASRSDGVPDPDWAARVIKLARGTEDRPVDRRVDATPHAQGRQCRRRTVELDRHARRHRQPQADLCGAADAERPRLRRMAVELNVSRAQRSTKWCAADPDRNKLRASDGSGSAMHHFVLHRIRETHSEHRIGRIEA